MRLSCRHKGQKILFYAPFPHFWQPRVFVEGHLCFFVHYRQGEVLAGRLPERFQKKRARGNPLLFFNSPALRRFPLRRGLFPVGQALLLRARPFGTVPRLLPGGIPPLQHTGAKSRHPPVLFCCGQKAKPQGPKLPIPQPAPGKPESSAITTTYYT